LQRCVVSRLLRRLISRLAPVFV